MLRDIEPKTPEEKKIANAEKAMNDAMNAYTMALTESWEESGRDPWEATMFAERQIILGATNHAATTFLALARLGGERLDRTSEPEAMRLVHLVLGQVEDKVAEQLPGIIETIMAADN